MAPKVKTPVSDGSQTGTGPELFIGLVGAVGTDLTLVCDLVSQELRRANYDPEPLRLSKLIADCAKYSGLRSLEHGPEDERMDQFMGAGDDLRRTAKRGDAVALLALGKIQAIRTALKRKGKAVPRHAYIFNSLKHPKEVETLREIYGQSFFLISAYSPRERRIKQLSEKIARSRDSYAPDDFRNRAIELIDKDEQEVGNEFGQNVRETFPLGDIFVDASNVGALRSQLNRIINILFGYPYTTPTVDEYGMFHARATALRSADLSRQVGAVITTADGEIVSAGCNEVPKTGGGAVWEGRAEDAGKDYRDFRLTYDPTAKMQRQIIAEVFERIRSAGWLSTRVRNKSADDLAAAALYEGEPPLKGTRVASIIEFGRIVHAEMSAVCDAARRGLSVKEATLYCTTFPCHMCARHIIASGIQQVVYIEPYPKSMAKELYPQLIRVDRDSTADADAVEFRPFVGVAPRRYADFFSMVVRKDKRGHAITWTPANSIPRVRQFPVHIDLELGHVVFLEENAKRWGITS